MYWGCGSRAATCAATAPKVSKAFDGTSISIFLFGPSRTIVILEESGFRVRKPRLSPTLLSKTPTPAVPTFDAVQSQAITAKLPLPPAIPPRENSRPNASNGPAIFRCYPDTKQARYLQEKSALVYTVCLLYTS